MQSKWHFPHSEKERLSGLPPSLKVSAVLLGEQWWVTARESYFLSPASTSPLSGMLPQSLLLCGQVLSHLCEGYLEIP